MTVRMNLKSACWRGHHTDTGQECCEEARMQEQLTAFRRVNGITGVVKMQRALVTRTFDDGSKR